MTSHIEFPCPRCPRTLRVPAEYLGRRIRCNHCGQAFVPAVEGGTPSTTPAGIETRAGASSDEAEMSRDGCRALEEEVRGLRSALDARAGELATALVRLQESEHEAVRLRGLAQEVRVELDRERAQGRFAATWKLELDRAVVDRDAARAQVEELRARACEADRLADQAGIDRAEVARLRVTVREASSSAESLAHDLDAARAERDRLSESSKALRARLEAESAEVTARAGRLAGELDAARAERLQVEAGRRAAEADAVRRQADGSERERALAEAAARHESAGRGLARAFDEARGRWEAERAALVRDAEQRLRAVQDRADADVAARDERLDAAEQQLLRDRQSAREDVERLGREVEAASRDRDEGLRLIEDLQAERCESGRRHRDERAGLAQALDDARRRGEEAGRHCDRWAGEVEALREALQTQVVERDEERRRSEADARQAERDRADERARVVAERAEWQGQLDAARGRHEREQQALRADGERFLRAALGERDEAIDRAEALADALDRARRLVEEAEAASRQSEGHYRTVIDRLNGELEEYRRRDAGRGRVLAVPARPSGYADDRPIPLYAAPAASETAGRVAAVPVEPLRTVSAEFIPMAGDQGRPLTQSQLHAVAMRLSWLEAEERAARAQRTLRYHQEVVRFQMKPDARGPSPYRRLLAWFRRDTRRTDRTIEFIRRAW